jgi:zinc transporter 2
LKEIDTVDEIHDLHVWSLSVGKPSMSAHLTVSSDNVKEALISATILCRKFGIYHSTI